MLPIPPRDRQKCRFRSPHRLALFVVLGLVAIPGSGGAESVRPDPAHGWGIIVKLRSEGPHAVQECAQTIQEQHLGFEARTADHSDSLDRLHERLRVRRVRALFRVPDGRPLSEQRARMRSRLRAGRATTRKLAALPDLSHVYSIEMAAGVGATLGEVLAAYRADPHVAYAQVDHVHHLDALPNDPFLVSSGSWGQAYEDLWGLHRIRAPAAWAISQGEGVVVAVVDTGVDYLHPDIADNIWINPGEDLNGNGRFDESDLNGLDDDANGFVDDIRGFDFGSSIDADLDGDLNGPGDYSDPDPFDDQGHGTHVAGTIAAVAGNGIGIAGVAPKAEIMALKGFADGEGLDSSLWRAVLYALENGAGVVNNSWSCSPACPDNPLADEIVALARALDVVIVTSAGNRLSDVVQNSPEKTADVITVGSSGQDDQRSATFSNFGFGVDLLAPGGGPFDDPSVDIPRRNILSLRASADRSPERFRVGDDYMRLSGTSMSAPHVSGVVALLRSADPSLGYSAIRRILRQSAVDLGPPGHDRFTGAGRLDALAALTHPPLPDLDAAILSPSQGAVRSPRAGPIAIHGMASGRDLLRWTLGYGLGNDPASFVRIATSAASVPAGGLLADWEVADLDPGTYVIRLEVEGRDGSLYQEYLVMSLESGRFDAISSIGPPAGAPAISGSLVVWESRRIPGSDPADGARAVDDLNLFATDWLSGHEVALQTGPGNQARASLAGRIVSWLGSVGDTTEAFACRLQSLRRLDGDCQALRVAPGVRVSLPPRVAAGRVYWIASTAGLQDIHACRFNRRGSDCLPESPGLEASRRSFLGSDGRTLVWTDFSGPQRFALCRIDRRTGLCAEASLADTVLPYSSPAASDGLVAWVDFVFSGPKPLRICQLDRATGNCPTVFVAEGVDDLDLSLSGNRLVFDASLGDEESDVFFCEFDRVLQECPVQRLTAHHSAQRASRIDGDRIVFEDDRDGATRISGVVLPRLAELRDRRVRAGEFVRIPIRVATRAHRPHSNPLLLEARGPDGVAVEDLGARFRDHRNGRGALRWRPRADQVGDHVFTFSATTESGLVTRRSMRVRVDEPVPAPDPPRDPPHDPTSLLFALWGLLRWLFAVLFGLGG